VPVATRRIGTETSESRTRLLDATERLMVREGYAAVSSRRVAKEAGLNPALVYYYFETMDDLFLALFRRGAEDNLARQARALASPKPLRELWRFSRDEAGTALMLEFMALANHRKEIRAEIARYAEEFRAQQVEALTPLLEQYGFDPAVAPAVCVMLLMSGISRALVLEQSIGVSTGHDETVALVEHYLDVFEGEDGSRDERSTRTRRKR
jgi:AcrR family transcriptional regulator